MYALLLLLAFVVSIRVVSSVCVAAAADYSASDIFVKRVVLYAIQPTSQLFPKRKLEKKRTKKMKRKFYNAARPTTRRPKNLARANNLSRIVFNVDHFATRVIAILHLLFLYISLY